MGSPDPRSFSRGKRGIAGSLVFTVFDRDALILALADETYTDQKINAGGGGVSSVDKWGQGIEVADDGSVGAAQFSINYADEIPPFDITVNFINEYGQSAVMRMYACEILNEGSGMSIDDITTDKACTFVARGIQYMKNITA